MSLKKKSKDFEVYIEGRKACFTRPEFCAERKSYEVMTPSAAAGVMDCIHWKKGMRWHISRIEVGSEIRFDRTIMNEINKSLRNPMPFSITDPQVRSQRNLTYLRDVSYKITAHFRFTREAWEPNNFDKHYRMFDDRLKHGKLYELPYLGIRDFIGDVNVCPPSFSPIQQSRDLGIMFWGFDYDKPSPHPKLFFRAIMENGVIEIPTIEEVRNNEFVDY